MIKAQIPGTNRRVVDGVFRGPHQNHHIPVNPDDRLDYTISSFKVDANHQTLINFGKGVCTEDDITIKLNYSEFLHAWMVLRQGTSLLRLARYADSKPIKNIQSHKNLQEDNRETNNLANEQGL